MKRTIVALLATTALAVPAFAASNTSNQPQQPNVQQQQAAQQQQQQQQQQAQNNNEPISPNKLSKDEVRQMQSALDKQGFNAGRPDGKFGPHTKEALQKFDQKKGIQSKNGQPTEQTLAQLGVNQNQDQNQQSQQNSQ